MDRIYDHVLKFLAATVSPRFAVVACNAVLLIALGASGATAAAPTLSGDSDRSKQIAQAIVDLKAADAEWRRNDAEFRLMRDKGESDENVVEEFAVFVAAGRRKVFENCEAVRKLGADGNEHGVECLTLEEGGGVSSEGDPQGIPVRQQTREEKVAQHKAELDELASEFDGMILVQQQALREDESTVPPSEDWGSGASSQQEGADGSSGTPGAVASDGWDGEPDGQLHEPGAGPGVAKDDLPEVIEVSGEVGDRSDDDVVAHQLREAAQAEADPVLREQLWDEYRDYKRGTLDQ